MRTKISIFVRSKTPIEKEAGIFEYLYTEIKDIPAQISNVTQTISNSTEINPQSTNRNKLSYIISNATPALAKRISYVLYDEILYTVTSNDPYPPRMTTIIDDVAPVSVSFLRDLEEKTDG